MYFDLLEACKCQKDVLSSSTSSRQTLSELNLVEHDRSGPLPLAPSTRRGTITRARHESAPTGRSTYSSAVPPPLPCSPMQQEKERRLRRKTVEKDLVVLNAANSVGRSKQLFSSNESPPPSPTKGKASISHEFGAPASPGLRESIAVLSRTSSRRTMSKPLVYE